MNDRQTDKLLDRALRDERQLPEGLSGRLERFVDALPVEEKPAARLRRSGWLAGAAAAAAVLVAVFVSRPRAPMADTCTDPAEAAAVVEQALGLLSANYNKGLDRVARAVAEMERANETVFKTIKNEQP